MSNLSYMITDKAVTLMLNAKTYTVNAGDDRYDEVVSAIREQREDDIPVILDLKGRLVSESNGGLYLMNGVLRCEEHDVPASLAQRIVAYFNANLDVTPLTNFFSNLRQNPDESGTVKEELHGFLEACNLPITPDGCFLAYKMVRSNFKDLYTGRMDNSVGKVVEIDRASCDFDRSRTCSRGLHFCSEDYLGCYGTRGSDQVVVVKVNPRDVTSIPTDYNNAKGRASRYEIVDAIGWDELITPWFEDKYDEPEQDELDLTNWSSHSFSSHEQDVLDEPMVEGMRWEVRDAYNGEWVSSHTTREDARDEWREDPQETFVWDAENQTIVAGVLQDNDLADHLADSGLPDEFVYDNQQIPFDEPETDPVNPSAKLTQDDVADIKSELNDMQSGESPYESYAELARAYNVSDRTIRRIRDGEAWVDVDPSR